MTKIWLSIVISTWNNCEELDRTLRSISRCVIPPSTAWEIVVVNNNSTDKTDDVLSRLSGKMPLARAFEPKQGLSYGKNTGLANAKGQWILFTDDDVRPHPNWIKEYVDAIRENPDGYFFGGPVTSIFSGSKPDPELLSVASKAVKGFALGHQGRTETEKNFLSANWAAPTEDLRREGGFDTEMGLNPARKQPRFGEESDLQNRLRRAGLRAIYLPNAKLGHVIPPQKTTRAYILGRAEASSADTAKQEPFNPARCVRLIASFCKHYSEYLLEKLSGRQGYLAEYQWRVRRGKLRQQAVRVIDYIKERTAKPGLSS